MTQVIEQGWGGSSVPFLAFFMQRLQHRARAAGPGSGQKPVNEFLGHRLFRQRYDTFASQPAEPLCLLVLAGAIGDQSGNWPATVGDHDFLSLAYQGQIGTELCLEMGYGNLHGSMVAISRATASL